MRLLSDNTAHCIEAVNGYFAALRGNQIISECAALELDDSLDAK